MERLYKRFRNAHWQRGDYGERSSRGYRGLTARRKRDYADIVGNPFNINADWTLSVWFKPDTGGRYSLVLNTPKAVKDVGNGASWRASASIGGAPGSGDSRPLPERPFGDDDGDGIGNLLAYATGGHPNALFSREWLPVGSGSNEYVVFRSPEPWTLMGLPACRN